jgi:DNA-binding HxlR family transcriptional regulator
VAKSLEFLGERWTLLIIRDLLRRGPLKFQDLSASLKGVAPAVLSSRLKVLEDHGIVTRQMYSKHPPRAEYSLTKRGTELRPVVRSLAIWGSRHLYPERTLKHDACESSIEMAYYCPSCDKMIAWEDASFHDAHGTGTLG